MFVGRPRTPILRPRAFYIVVEQGDLCRVCLFVKIKKTDHGLLTLVNFSRRSRLLLCLQPCARQIYIIVRVRKEKGGRKVPSRVSGVLHGVRPLQRKTKRTHVGFTFRYYTAPAVSRASPLYTFMGFCLFTLMIHTNVI